VSFCDLVSFEKFGIARPNRPQSPTLYQRKASFPDMEIFQVGEWRKQRVAVEVYDFGFTPLADRN
jgi:hypothetical protein